MRTDSEPDDGFRHACRRLNPASLGHFPEEQRAIGVVAVDDHTQFRSAPLCREFHDLSPAIRRREINAIDARSVQDDSASQLSSAPPDPLLWRIRRSVHSQFDTNESDL